MSYPNKHSAAFVRLHVLVRKGYKAELGATRDTNLIRLDHPRGAAEGAPCLNLDSDGTVYGVDNEQPLSKGSGVESDCIFAETDSDRQTFETFISGVPEPTLWQTLNAISIWEMKMLLVTGIICGVLAGGLAYFSSWGWRLLTSWGV